MQGGQLLFTKTALRADLGVRTALAPGSPAGNVVLVGYDVDARGWEPLEHLFGRPLSARSRFTSEEVDRQLEADIHAAEHSIRSRFAPYDRLDPVRQRALVQFVFVHGTRGSGFTEICSALRLALAHLEPALQGACFTAAAYHARRNARVAHMLHTGEPLR